MRTSKPILLIEDDQVDAMTVKRALQEINVTNTLHVVTDGEQALTFLQNPDNDLPGIILLDLNMTRMNGIEFLKVATPAGILAGIPVIVLTTSSEDQDKIDSFNLGISGYMVKPVDFRKFVEVMKTIDMYWTLSELPS